MAPETARAASGADVALGAPVRELARHHFRYLSDLMASVDLAALERVVACLRAAHARGSAVFIAGNGGSAATASHLAVDLGKTLRRLGGPTLRVTSLTDNAAWMTAVANDEGYDDVFVGQLENHLRPRDVVIVVSASGNSPNLLRAVEFARSRGAVTVGLVGFDGGRLVRSLDVPLFIPSEVGFYGPIEDLHAILGHVIVECLSWSAPGEDGAGRD